MKNLFFTVAALLSFGFVNGQDTGIKFGVKGGVQFTNFVGDLTYNNKTGFFIGGLVDLPVSDNFHVQPELMYSMEGSEYDFDFGFGQNESFDYGISYIRIPVMAKYYVIQGLSLQAGPEIAFKIGAENDIADDSIKSTDFGIGAGAGYELPIGLMFDIRYNLGLANISENEDGDVKNVGIQLGVGYRF